MSCSQATTSKKEVVIFLDWDETISSHDTLALIAPPDGQHPGPDFTWYGKEYMADLDRYAKDFGERDNLQRQLQFLKGLDKVELASQKRIEEGGLFQGFDPIAMEERARRNVELRKGWEIVSPILGEHHIISVGWSARFIESALRGSCKPTSICANEVELDRGGKGTGRLTKSKDAGHVPGRYGIRTGDHKLREMKRILKDREREDLVVIYAGDSNTDLPCLFESDFGLILGGGKSIKKSLVDTQMETCLSESKAHWERRRTKLVIVNNWNEGRAVIEQIMS